MRCLVLVCAVLFICSRAHGSKVVKVAATQMACSADSESNINNAVSLVREAHSYGAQIILLQELFATLYFCQEQDPKYYLWATNYETSPMIATFAALAKELQVVLPISFFEKANNAYYNSIAVIDASGEVLGRYRKSHIPDAPGYQEKFYFTPGDSGFKVFDTMYARIGVAICWDQWFPEAARVMALMGAEIIFYPTAIGSEPHDPSIVSLSHWQRTMMGHAAANMVPVVASNRIGMEVFEKSNITFYGGSFITDNTGFKLREADSTNTSILLQELDLEAYSLARAYWGIYRDRRPDLYQTILTKDGGLSPTGTNVCRS